MAAQTILNTYPADAFSIVAGPGNFFSGGAVAFQAPRFCQLNYITLMLRDYDGTNHQDIEVQLLANYTVATHSASSNWPGCLICDSFKIPGPNDGSIGEFVFELPAGVALKGGGIYWILVYGKLNHTCMQGGALLHWVEGKNGQKNPAFIGSLSFVDGNYLPSSVIPAFILSTT